MGKKRNRKQRKRTMCGCQATLHDVFKNCTKCGNILCIIEGEGPCFYCSAYVTLAGTTTSIEALDKISANNENSEEFRKAVAQKDKLLRFGREKIAQTTIIDDQGDFYENEANNLWLSQRERDLAKAKEEEKKLNESRADKAMEININFGIGTANGVEIIEAAQDTKTYAFASIDREKERKQKQKENERNLLANESNKVANSWYHNSSLTGHASKVYASLQKMINSEKEKLSKNNETTTNGAADEMKNAFVEEANSDLSDDEDE